MTSTTTATYTKLKDGTWGVRVQGAAKAGDTVKVTKKDGTAKTETLVKVLWTGDGITLATIAQRDSTGGRGGAPRRSGRGTWTGCSCGSVEEYSKASDCFTCRHDAE